MVGHSSGQQCHSPPGEGSKVRAEGSDGLGGAVVDQAISVLQGYRDSVDRHTLVLRRLPL